MGGIVGKLSFDPGVRISPDTVRRMLAAIGHRGAAATARYDGDGIALAWGDAGGAAAARVAAGGSGDVRTVADAELSNGAALRRSLERLGHVIADDSDAALMAHAYEEWGDACVERFSGPFACAIWDERQRRLLLARDHAGVRPLVFALLHGDGVVFGSEIKALLQDPAVGRECHPEAIDAYLALGYVPSPLTMYRRVSKLEPAHTLVVEGRRLTTRQYWDVPAAPRDDKAEGSSLDLLHGLLRTSARAQASGPATGLLVSGGPASTALATVLPPGSATITVGLEHEAPELARIGAAADRLGHRCDIEIASPDPGAVAGLLAWHFDEPLADPGAVSQYALFVAARRHVEVAVTGHGSAILWGGHRSGLDALLPPMGWRTGGSAAAAAARRAGDLFGDDLRHAIYTRTFSWNVREADPFARAADPFARCGAADPRTRALAAEARTFLPDHHLAVADRAAAAAGLRLRFPFLDLPLLELAFTAPAALKRGSLLGGAGPYAMRRLAARHLPRHLMPPRRAAAPVPWLREALAALVPAVLLGDRCDARGIFSRPALRALWAEHQARPGTHARRLWAVLMLELWFREFIDGDADARPLPDAVLVRAA